ncbi:MAG: hypothetical protein N4A46_05010 [Schleiferiaceae bacterium]|nr:hypothetical protein [Schleiferiaceae bacterium]
MKVFIRNKVIGYKYAYFSQVYYRLSRIYFIAFVLLISVIGHHSCKKETVPISNFCSNDTISFSSLYGITGSLKLNGEPFKFNPETDYLKPTADPDWFSVVIRQNKGCFDRYTFYIDLINTNDSTKMSDPHPRGRSF